MTLNRFIEKIKLTDDIKFILKKLQEHGQGYIVGGYIRDCIIGLEPKDCDFVTDIEYDKLLNIFKEYSPKEIGRHFRVIQIKLNNETYEIAKMRMDIGVPKNRNIQKIEFVKDIHEDLKRRDFIINAIAYDGRNIITIDDSIFLKNLNENKLTFVGNPDDRIKEDPLRILRYFRFLSTKGFEYDEKICEIIKKNKKLLNSTSKERIKKELNKIILSKYSYSALKLMKDYEILQEVIQELKDVVNLNEKNKNHCFTLYMHI